MAKLTLERLLQSQGYGTRKYCRALIFDGALQIDGEVVDDPGFIPADPEKRAYSLDGVAFRYRPQLYLALHKPPNYECSRKPSHHPGVLTLFPDPIRARDVQPVGRLDHDTTGLLLLSDDGAFIHAQTSPRRHVPKYYHASTAEDVSQDLIAHMLAGVQLHDEPAPLKALECSQLGPRLLQIVLEQGKYHQVKRMLAACGNHCAALTRVQIGGLTLQGLGLQEGQWCYLEAEHLAQLRGQAEGE
ncbi:pseudouridine synthase [Massilia sp. W12]|uniref:pseudouridine synthase n=1 Tax=Massilia sp. W12 TaxID=3126507 RepID=UPI0030D2D8BF